MLIRNLISRFFEDGAGELDGLVFCAGDFILVFVLRFFCLGIKEMLYF